jgi:hypothetical protein
MACEFLHRGCEVRGPMDILDGPFVGKGVGDRSSKVVTGSEEGLR